MKIVIDARMYSESGIGRYIRNLILNLQKLDTVNQYFILHLKKDFQSIEYKGNFHGISADFGWYGLSEQIKLPKLLKFVGPDLVHFPHFNVPVLFGGKFVVTIHDLIHQHFSMQRATTRGPLIYKLKQLGYKKVFRNALGKSKKIIVPSVFVREQLEENYQINEEKIVVTPEAVDDNLAGIKTIKRYDFPYIFYVGNAHPHKNIEGLIKSFLIIKENHKSLKLILAGADHYFWQRIKKEFRHPDIIYKDWVNDEELAALYKNAKAFVLPSFEEGFGIPLLEAMSLSCPVISSNAGSLPEVGDDAAVYFNPQSGDSMTQKIEMVLDDDKLRSDLIKKGLKRYKDFSWRKLAEQTLEVYRQCV